MTTTVRSAASTPSSAVQGSGPRPPTRSDAVAVAAVAVAAGVAAAAAGCRPTGVAVADLLITALAAAGVTWAASRARPWTILLLATVALVAGPGWLHLIGGLAVAAAVWVWRGAGRRSPIVAALVAALSVNVLSRLGGPGVASWDWASAPIGSSGLVAAAACVPVLASAWQASGRVARRRLAIGTAAVLGLTAIATVGFAVAAAAGHADMSDGIVHAQRGLDAAERGDHARAAVELRSSADAFARARRDFDAPWTWPARLVPVLGHYALVASDLARAGYTVAAPSADAALKVPYERITAQPGRIDLPVLQAIEAPMTSADTGVDRAAAIVDGLDTSWLVPALANRIERYRSHLDGAVPEADRALEAVRLTPTLLGGHGARRYLLLFGNPAESRPLGGYAGAYAVLVADHGQLRLTTSGRTEDLADAPAKGASVASRLGWPVPLYDPGHHLGNITASADFPSMASAASQLFGASMGTHFDGVLYVDPKGLAALVGLVGSIRVDGLDQALAEQNLAQFLVRDQYVDFTVRSERFDFLSAAARETFHLLTTRSLPSPAKVFEQIDPAVVQGHLLLWTDVPATAKLFDEVRVSGRLKRPQGTALVDLRTANLSQNKTDAFLHRTVDIDATYDHRHGTIDADVTVTLHNGAPIDLSPYVLSNRWRRAHEASAPAFGSDTLLVSFASSLQLRSADLDGRSLSMQARPTGNEPDGDVTTYATDITVPAGHDVVLHLRLRGRLPSGHEGSLLIVHQPLANDDRVRVITHEGAATRVTGPFTLTETRTIALP